MNKAHHSVCYYSILYKPYSRHWTNMNAVDLSSAIDEFNTTYRGKYRVDLKRTQRNAMEKLLVEGDHVSSN